ncbi:MAG: SDR family oxidoreductase [Deltaproteobacteria bacterium]|nr:MAG: SDR family oxidoreductase [Deltaproteobacteria bacterium]
MVTRSARREGTGRTALVTGASAGIGQALAARFAERGFDLVLVARREERLREVARELGERHGSSALVLPADLGDPEAPRSIHERLGAEGIAVDALINNAGYGIAEDYTDTTWEEQARFLQVMATAPAHLMHLFLPGMIERGYGRIINVASLAALLPGLAGHTLYSGVKAFLVKTSQSLMIELAGTGVHVTAICPGFTYTEYHDVIRTRKSVSEYPGFMWMSADEVARQGYDAVMAGKPVYVNGRVNQLVAFLARVLPEGLLMKAARRQVVEE